ncbi:MAG: family 78 glycoside hydrolase catalytic domain [Bacteroidales bacterium]|nr:family 78 glycoside hydrolase catalytic domain [Bacteroidales bacterium]
MLKLNRLNKFYLLLLAVLTIASCKEKAQLDNLRCEYRVNPIGLDVQCPRFSWEYSAADDMQLAYRIEVAADPAFKDIVWDSGALGTKAERKANPELFPESGRQMVNYLGRDLEPFTKYHWRLTTLMASGAVLQAPVQTFETGMLPGYKWQAQWISDSHDKEFAPAPMLRKVFRIDGELASARLFVSAAAYYKMAVNGTWLNPVALSPDYTDYSKRNQYQVYDVTGLLASGDNALAAVLGNGFYNEIEPVATWDFDKAHWRGRARMIAELHLKYSDGRTEIICTDPGWKTATGPSLSNNIYSGEIYDARLEIPGWEKASFDDSAWASAVAVEAPSPKLVAQNNAPAKVCEEFEAVDMKKFSDSLYVFSFPKNIAGVSSLSLSGAKPGTKIKLRHGELKKEDGLLQMGNIDIFFYPKPDFEMQTDIYYAKGGEESFTPSFTYHGFQYVEVSADAPIQLDKSSLKALFIHTDLAEAGSFACSDELVNWINSTSKLSYLGNLVSIPTDCPHREKNGWTADANISIDLGLLNYDGLTFYEKWVNDMADSQNAEGNVPGIVPSSGWGYEDWIGPVWASAFCMIPDALMHYYGDPKAIETIFDTCDRYLDYLGRRLDPDGTVTYGIGDWVYYDTPTPTDYSTSLFYYWQNVLMTKFAGILGRDAKKYQEKAEFLKDLINQKHFNKETCLYGNGSQAGQGMALMFDIVPQEYKQKVAANLNQSIVDNNYYLDFGCVGSKFVPRVLADYGYAETVFKMMLKEDVPSWGAWRAQGLTTLAERWKLDFVKFYDSSANHVFLGDISAWMVKYLAGIHFDMDADGGCNLAFKPCTPEGLDWAKAEYKSVRGLIKSEWHRTAGGIELKVTVPANMKATVEYGETVKEIGGGMHVLKL